jgi:hypothetical protein
MELVLQTAHIAWMLELFAAILTVELRDTRMLQPKHSPLKKKQHRVYSTSVLRTLPERVDEISKNLLSPAKKSRWLRS